MASYVDGNGNEIMRELDGIGQEIGAADEVGPLSSEIRNEQNLVLARTDGEGNTTLFEYDERGNITRITDAISTEAFQWSGAVSGNWNDATKWVGGIVPGPTDDVVIIGEVGADFTITISEPVTVQSLVFGGTGSESLKVTSDLIVAGGVLIEDKGRIDLDEGTITGDILVEGTLAAKGKSQVNGAIEVGSQGTLRIAAANSKGARFTVSDGLTNEGAIILDIDTQITFQTDASLTVTNGILLNRGTIQSLNTGRGGKSRTITADLQNEGIIRTNYPLKLSNTNRIFKSTGGTIDLIDGNVLDVFDGQTILGANTVFPGTGTLRFRQQFNVPVLDIQGDITLTDGGTKFDFFNGITVNGPGSLTIGNNVTLAVNDDNFSADLDLIVAGVLLVNGRNIAVDGGFTLSDGSLLRLAATGANGAHITFADGFTNSGKIILDIDTDSTFQTDASITVTNGTLVNAGTIESLNTGGGGKSRTINAVLENDGTILVNYYLKLTNVSRIFTSTNGTIDLVGSNVFDIFGGQTILGANTVFPGTGTLRFRQQSGSPVVDILGDITLTEGGTKFDLFDSVTVNGPGSLTVGENVALTLNGDTFGSDLNLIADGMLLVNGRNVFVNGGFSLSQGSLLRLAATGSNGAHMAIANGFTNAGEIIFDIDTDSNFQTDASLTITDGTLVNLGTIQSLNTGGGGKSRTLSTVLDNQGLLLVDYTFTLSDSAANHVNSGTVMVDAFLRIQNHTSFRNQSGGVVEFSGNNTMDINNGSFLNASGGILRGFGTVDASGAAFTNEGLLQPGGVAGTNAFTITGSYLQSATGKLEIELLDPDTGPSDQLIISSAATLGGELAISPISGTTITADDIFPILTYASNPTQFDTITGLDSATGVSLDPVYNATDLTLTAVATQGKAFAQNASASVQAEYSTAMEKEPADTLRQTRVDKHSRIAVESMLPTFKAQEMDVLPDVHLSSSDEQIEEINSVTSLTYAHQPVSIRSESNRKDQASLFEPPLLDEPVHARAIVDSTPPLSTAQLAVPDPVGRLFTYESNFNRLTSITDELGRKTFIEIDPVNGDLLSLTRVIGQRDSESSETDDVITNLTHNDNGLVETLSDPLGRVSTPSYDELGRITSTTFALGSADEATERYEYDAAGNQTGFIDPDGNRTEFVYDSMNRLTQIVNPDPDGDGPLPRAITEFGYDEAGNQVLGIDPHGNRTVTLYDTLDRVVKIIDANLDESEFGYDTESNQVLARDPVLNETVDAYDARNRVVEVLNADDGNIQFIYDLNDNMVAVVDPVNNQTDFSFDARNRITAEMNPLGAITELSYDRADNIILQTDRNGRKTRFVYDSLNRLVSETWENADESVANVIQYTYDAADNLLSVADTFSSLTYTYDGRDRIVSVDNVGTPGAPKVVLTYLHDARGNVLSVDDTIDGGSGAENTYTYDSLNRLTTLTQSGTSVSDKRVDFKYTGSNRFETITRFSDLSGSQLVTKSAFLYDSLDRIDQISHTDSSENTVASYNYEFDSAGRVSRIADLNDASDYEYDSRGRLISAINSNPDLENETYSFDTNNNRIASHQHGVDYLHGDGNRLLSDGEFDYEYDAEGNLIRRIDISTGSFREFEWDHRNRLTAIVDKDVNESEQQRVSFIYDALNRRITKTVLLGSEEVVTYFIYDREDIIMDFFDADGPGGTDSVLHARYLHGPLIDQVLAQEDDIGGVHWLLRDRLGTVKNIIDSNGVVLDFLVHESFGNVISGGESSMNLRYGYTGREYDSEVDLYYYRSRFYDSNNGRFLSEDPVGFSAGDTNLYAYVRNAPVNFVDPSGLQPSSTPMLPFPFNSQMSLVPSEPSPVPIAYPSTRSDSSTTTTGTTSGTSSSPGNFSSSQGDETGSAGGVASSKMKSKTGFENFSTDVKFEGKPVTGCL